MRCSISDAPLDPLMILYIGASKELRLSTTSSNIDCSSVLYKAWQVCGDSHCLSAKLSDSLGAHLEDYELENSEDSAILSIAIKIAKLTKEGSS